MSFRLLLLFAVVAYLLYRIGKEVFATDRHLDDETLTELANGTLKARDAAGFRQASQHVATCEACRERFDRAVAGRKGSGRLIERRY